MSSCDIIQRLDAGSWAWMLEVKKTANNQNQLPPANIVDHLRQEILQLEGFRPSDSSAVDVGLGPLRDAFPNSSFPLGAVHEFLSDGMEVLTAGSGFIAGLLSALMQNKGTALWISASRKIFPPALKSFGVHPDRFIFVDVRKEKDVMWAMDEALKCGALTAVVGEMRDMSFTESRRLQLAVEHSRVTGFVLRNNLRKINTTACVSRWRIRSLPSETIDNMPGIGSPKWNVELLRIRNGKPGTWQVTWNEGRFNTIVTEHSKDETLPLHMVS